MATNNGSGSRKCKEGWIDAFIEYTSNLEAAPMFRKWSAISALAAVLEQKVWLQTSAPLYPNLYVFLVGHPGVGKTRTINAASAFLREVPDFHLAPTSMSAASLVDALVDAKRSIIRLPDAPLEYNSLTICADELSAFMHKYDDEMIGNLTTFYDVVIPYAQHRRGKEIRIKIKHPQLSILSGTTPSNLMKFLPDNAWDQGFTSRVIMVFSDERIITNIFEQEHKPLPKPMLEDLRIIASLSGAFSVTQDYKNAIHNWRQLGQTPIPTHPKLTHYNTRRLAHLFKLSMVSCVNKSNALVLAKEDFNTAMGWLLEAEQDMGEIFRQGSVSVDSKAMDEIVYICQRMDKGNGVAEPILVRRARELVPAMAVLRLFEVMERSKMIQCKRIDKGIRYFTASPFADS